MKQIVFNDFYEFSAAVRNVDCTMMIQHNTSEHVWCINQVTISKIEIQLGHLCSGNIIEGQSRSDGFLYYLPLTETVDYVANGQLIGKGSVLIFAPQSEFTVSTKVNHDWCSLFIPTTLLVNSSYNSDYLAQRSSSKNIFLTRSNLKLANQLKTIIEKIMSAGSIGNLPSNSSPAAAKIAQELLMIGALLLGESHANAKTEIKGRKKISRDFILQQGHRILKSNTDKVINVSDIATECGVSERTVRNVYKEYYGICPKHYLAFRQLNLVRKELFERHFDNVTVKEILMKHGIWEFGRFSLNYKRHFGQSPLETLKKKFPA